MERIIKVIISIALLVVLTIGFYYASKAISNVTGKSILGWVIDSFLGKKDKNLDLFVKCLNEKEIVLYIEKGNSECEEQKEIFKNSIDNLNLVDCSFKSSLCLSKNIKELPAWEFSEKEIIYGKKSLEEISEISGCVIK